jgi:hypothetical protein
MTSRLSSIARIAAFACAVLLVAPAAAQAQPDALPPDFQITLERTACFGTCPVYKVSIDAGGAVTYDGTEFVRVTGRQTARVQRAQVAALLEAAKRIGFFELRDEYRTVRNADGSHTEVTDLPTAFVTIVARGRTKRVEDYYGAPDGLRALEQLVDDTARTNRWIRIDVATLQEMAGAGRTLSATDRAKMLEEALQHDEVDVVKALLGMGVDPNLPSPHTTAPPLMMVRSPEAARALLDAGANPSGRSDNDGTPLGWAAHVDPAVAAMLVKAGAPVDGTSDSDGRTPLWQAACTGNIGVVRILLAAGADPGRAAGGKSAVECAREMANLARRFPDLERGDRPFVRDFDGVIALLERAQAAKPAR